MRVIVQTGPGELELNYMMLPTFIGMNTLLKKELEAKFKVQFEGQPMTDEFLDRAHDLIIDFLVEKFAALKGLREYLDGVKYIADR